jgi:hypothetical protein
MKKLLVSICVAVVVGGIGVGCPALPMASTIHINLPDSPEARTFQPNENLASNLNRPSDPSGQSCANPRPGMVKKCQGLEQQILASTVRLEWHVWIKKEDANGYTRVDRIGHATIKDGRYLVTHNHGEIQQSDLTSNRLNRISIFTAAGVPRLMNVPLTTVAIAVQDAETLVLDFGVYDGQGLFAMEGMSSAEFKAWESLLLQPGMQVAQVIWDGETASVAWVKIDDIVTDGGTPRLELDNTVKPGTSGGGVFWNGYHVANTWSQRTVLNASGEAVSRQCSVAALNSPHVAARLR